MDTNANEAFNQTCTWLSPKNNVFAGSGSLHNRLSIAVGVNSLGYKKFFTALFSKLGIEMTDNVAHYLRLKENNRVKQIAKTKTKDAKLAKNSKKRAKLVTNTRIAKAQFHKLQGTYKKGMNVEDPYGEQAALDEAARKPAARAKSTTTTGGNASSKYCECCGRKGHATTKHNECTAGATATKKYRQDDGSLVLLPPIANAVDEGEEDNFVMPSTILDDDHMIDCDANDILSFDHGIQGAESNVDLERYHDVETWSEQDEDDMADGPDKRGGSL
jgi:hypothetical protein